MTGYFISGGTRAFDQFCFVVAQHMINPGYATVSRQERQVAVTTEKVTDGTPVRLFYIRHFRTVNAVEHQVDPPDIAVIVPGSIVFLVGDGHQFSDPVAFAGSSCLVVRDVVRRIFRAIAQ